MSINYAGKCNLNPKQLNMMLKTPTLQSNRSQALGLNAPQKPVRDKCLRKIGSNLQTFVDVLPDEHLLTAPAIGSLIVTSSAFSTFKCLLENDQCYFESCIHER